MISFIKAQVIMFTCIGCAFFGFSHQTYGQSVIPKDIQEKIRVLDSLPSLSSLFVKPSVVFSTTTSTTSLFKKGICPQSPVNQDDVYMLQTINTVTGLPKAYVPKNLVNIATHIKTAGGVSICMTESSATQLYKMSQDMEKIGLQLVAISGYRSFEGQKKLFDIYAPIMNRGVYNRVAPPGHSEHQLGTTIDVASDIKSGPEFALTAESKWIETNAHKYGFIVSYDEGHEDKTGYMYEPWHLRYVGVSNATILKKGEYSLAYKPTYYKGSWINKLLGRLKDYIDIQEKNNISIGG
jgi:LAS superfamily LD-carboxypeptidase LdcB